MTHLDDGTIVTDLTAHDENNRLTTAGYTIRHVETWHGHDHSAYIVWDAPEITETDCPY